MKMGKYLKGYQWLLLAFIVSSIACLSAVSFFFNKNTPASALKSSVSDWGAWREKNPDSKPDLSGIDLGGRYRNGVDLSDVILKHAKLGNADLEGANLEGADLEGANLEGARLYNANLEGANLTGANLSRASLRSTKLAGANLNGANLSGADLSRADLRTANLKGADLNWAKLEGANLFHGDLMSNNLSNADLKGANLEGANLERARLFDANLEGANLTGANLSDANLRSTMLEGADLNGANLSGADLRNSLHYGAKNANFVGAKLEVPKAAQASEEASRPEEEEQRTKLWKNREIISVEQIIGGMETQTETQTRIVNRPFVVKSGRKSGFGFVPINEEVEIPKTTYRKTQYRVTYVSENSDVKQTFVFDYNPLLYRN